MKDNRATTDINVKDLRANLRELVERAEAGEEISILRRGKQVARLVPPQRRVQDAPDLAEFRASITIKGEPMSETVSSERREARY